MNVAYEQGLLSEETFTYRFDQLLGGRLIDPGRLIGDLRFRRSPGWRAWLLDTISALRQLAPASDEVLLALDWTGEMGELVVGRHQDCDVVLDDSTVSRRHVRLVFHDDTWALEDLDSTNGTIVNGVSVARCALRPGDHLLLGEAQLRID